MRAVEALVAAKAADAVRRVVITGAGQRSTRSAQMSPRPGSDARGALGHRPDAISRRRAAVDAIGAAGAGLSARGRTSPARSLALSDRFTQFALLAARQAVAQSGLVFDDELARARGGGARHRRRRAVTTSDENYRAVYEEGKNRVHPFVVPRLMHNAAASHVSMALQPAGARPSRCPPPARRRTTRWGWRFRWCAPGRRR